MVSTLPAKARTALRISPIAFCALLAGCTTFTALNATEPDAGVRTVRDIAYQGGARGRLDVFAPIAAGRPRPVVVFFYGGTWNSGRKDWYSWVGAALASRGYVAVLPDYRVYPQVNYPDFLRDNAKAVLWAREHAPDYGGDPSKIFVMGHSAGAYNAAMLAIDKRWLMEVGLDPRKDLAGLIGLSGPYDFLPVRTDQLKVIFGPEEERPSTQPINHVESDAPPALLVTGDKDGEVDPGNADRLGARLAAAGDVVTVKHYPNLDHGWTVGALHSALKWAAPVLADISAFIDQHSGVGRAGPP